MPKIPLLIPNEKNIIIFSRQGEAQLNQAIPKLEALFKRTNDIKVRDDLITLYLRTNQSAKHFHFAKAAHQRNFLKMNWKI